LHPIPLHVSYSVRLEPVRNAFTAAENCFLSWGGGGVGDVGDGTSLSHHVQLTTEIYTFQGKIYTFDIKITCVSQQKIFKILKMFTFHKKTLYILKKISIFHNKNIYILKQNIIHFNQRAIYFTTKIHIFHNKNLYISVISHKTSKNICTSGNTPLPVGLGDNNPPLLSVSGMTVQHTWLLTCLTFCAPVVIFPN
jgi:hypothetical protein